MRAFSHGLMLSRWKKRALSIALRGVLCGCAVAPRPMDSEERGKLAADTQRRMFEGQEALNEPLTLSQAVARAIKYQAEHRQRRMEEAAAEAQLDVAKFDLLPKLMLNAGYSWRNNEAFGFGFTPNGTIATTPTASQERTHNTSSIGLAWNLLAFAVSYFNARQLAHQKLITEERRRKAAHTLTHDLPVACRRPPPPHPLSPPTHL